MREGLKNTRFTIIPAEHVIRHCYSDILIAVRVLPISHVFKIARDLFCIHFVQCGYCFMY